MSTKDDKLKQEILQKVASEMLSTTGIIALEKSRVNAIMMEVAENNKDQRQRERIWPLIRDNFTPDPHNDQIWLPKESSELATIIEAVTLGQSHQRSRSR